MTLLWTLLTTFFVDDGPSVPAPEKSGAIVWECEFDKVSVGESFNLPRLTPPTWHRSPSWMVASPSVKPTPFDVFSPAARPPQDFPGLIPCDPVALVPCPAPSPNEESPAVRHVSFAGAGANFLVAANDCPEDAACPAPGVCPHSLTATKSQWQKLHAKGHAACEPAAPFLTPIFTHGGFFAPPHPGHPIAVCAPGFEEQPLVAHRGGPFPGAKKVQHVVSATYDVPNESGEKLQAILKQGEGVLDCRVEGDELTVTAYPPYQSAIAQFLSAMDLVNSKSQPTRMIDVNTTNSKCCNGECACKKCTCECKCCGKKDETTASNDCCNFSLAKSLAYHYYGLVKPKQIEACSGTKPCAAACPPEAYCPTPRHSDQTVKSNTTPSKTIQVEILATPEGVMLQTSDGTSIRADRIQLHATDINQLKVEQAKPVPAYSIPRPASFKKDAKLPTY